MCISSWNTNLEHCTTPPSPLQLVIATWGTILGALWLNGKRRKRNAAKKANQVQA